MGDTYSRSVKLPEDRLSQRIRDMNISTSFISDPDAESASSSPKLAEKRPHARSFTGTTSLICSKPSAIPQPMDKRQAVLECIGTMLDEQAISEAEASTAIGLSMLEGGTHERIFALLESRKTMAGKSAFLRLWLRTLSKPSELIEPSPIPLQAPSDESDFMRPLMRSQSNCNLEILPIPSPPLVPVALNFADGSPLGDAPPRLGLAKFVKYMNQPISTPSTAMSPSPELTIARTGSQSSDD